VSPRIAGSLLCLSLFAPASAPAERAQEIARVVYLMGTRATLATYDGDEQRGQLRLERLLRSLEQSESELSTWRSDSVISRLNAALSGVPAELPPAVCRLFTELDRWTRETGGTFDPAVGALTAAWGVHGEGRVPDGAELRRALARSGWTRLGFDARRCVVTRGTDVQIDVGAFGKGAALDRAALDVGDPEAAWLVDLGGQVAVHGAPPQGTWEVDVAHPVHRDRPLLRLSMRAGGLATSGNSERQHVVGARRIGHILDPRTGQPAAFSGSVTVWHESGLGADILSTALFVMGPEEGLRWAEAREIAACFLAGSGRRIERFSTTAFGRRFHASALP